MEPINREPTDLDLKMFAILRALAPFSKCRDKQVACAIINRDGSAVYGMGVNTIIRCDQRCHDKENRVCEVRHAEATALSRCNQQILEHAIHAKDLVAYVNLFPCRPCQETLWPFVSEICAVGPVHKELVVPVTVFTAEAVYPDGYRPF